MRWLKGALVKVAAAIFPWAPRHERRAAIAEASREKERSQAGAEYAEVVKSQIQRLAAANHFASAIADDIIQGHHHRRRDGA